MYLVNATGYGEPMQLLYDSMGDHVVQDAPDVGVAKVGAGCGASQWLGLVWLNPLSVQQWVMEHRTPAFIPDTSSDSRIDTGAEFGFELRSLIAIPLFFDDSSSEAPVAGVLQGKSDG